MRVLLRKKCPYSELFWSKCGKMRSRITSNTDTFHAVFQLIVSEVFGHHKQGSLSNLHLKLFLSIYLLNRLMVLWIYHMNVTGYVWITVVDLKSFYHLTENIVLVKLFETSFGSDLIAAFTDFQGRGTDYFSLI